MKSRRATAALGTVLVSMSIIVGSAVSAKPSSSEATSTSMATSTTALTADSRSNLKNIKSAVGRVKKATLDVINDVTMRKLTDDEGDPLFFEPSDRQVDKDPSLFAKEGTSWSTVEAPRKSWLDQDVKATEHWVDALKTDVDALSKASGATPPVQVMQTVVKDMTDNLDKLKTLSGGPTYDNLSIAKAALAIHEDLKKLEAPWKTAMSELHK